MLSPLVLAITALIVGALALGLAWLAAVLIERRRVSTMVDDARRQAFDSELAPNREALILARPQGQIVFANDPARRLFTLSGGRPTLNKLAGVTEPREAFYELFTREGSASLQVANYRVHASSMRLPVGDSDPWYAIVFREQSDLLPGAPLHNGTAAAISTEAITEISRVIAASLSLDDTLVNILSILGRIIPYEFAEISLWHDDLHRLQALRRDGELAYTQSVSFQLLEHNHADYGAWRRQPDEPLTLNDIGVSGSNGKHADFPFRSLVAMPLRFNQNLIGALELASAMPNAFSDEQVALLRIIAGQAAIAVNNAQLYAQQQQANNELRGLVNIVQSAATISDPTELYASLSAQIAELVDVEICGFLTYRRQLRALAGESPFFGLDDDASAAIHLPVLSNTPLSRLLKDSPWYVANDFYAELERFGSSSSAMSDFVNQAGINSVLLVPLISNNVRFGAVMACNKSGGAPFTDNDAQLLAVLAGQAAAIIDNARRIAESERRQAHVLAIQHLAKLGTAATSLDDLFTDTMDFLGEHLKADLGVILLHDPLTGELRPHAASALGATPQYPAELARVTATDPAYPFTVTQTRRTFFSRRASADRRILGAYQTIRDAYDIESVIIAPLMTEERAFGELMIGTHTLYGLSRDEIPLVEVAARQLAGAIVRDELTSQTDSSLQRRADQLAAVTHINRDLNQTLELERIIESVAAEARRATRAECSVVIVRSGDNGPEIRQRIGDLPPKTPLTLHERKTLDEATHVIIGELAANERPTAETRSAMLVPIIHQGEVVGLIHMFSRRPGAFSRSMLAFVSVLADQAAIATGNANRYEQQMARGELLRQRADQLERLLDVSRSIRSSDPLDESLADIAQGIQDTVGFDEVMVSCVTPDRETLQHVAAAGIPVQAFERIRATSQPWRPVRQQILSGQQHGDSYYLPEEGLYTLLRGSHGEDLGVLRVRHNTPRLITRALARSVEVFANQAALAIENAQLLQTQQQHAAELAQKLDELQHSYAELDRANQDIVTKDAELQHALDQLDNRARSLLTLHRISSAFSGMSNHRTMARTAAEMVTHEFGVDVCLVCYSEQDQLNLLAAAGLDDTLDGTALSRHNPAQHVVNTGSSIHLPQVAGSEWQHSSLVSDLGLTSLIGVPFAWSTDAPGDTPSVAQPTHRGCLLLATTGDTAPLGPDALDIFTLLANQIGTTIENVSLYSEIQGLQNLNEAVLESIRQGLIVVDTQHRVLLVNDALRAMHPQRGDAGLHGQPLYQLFTEFADSELNARVQTVLDNGNPFEDMPLSLHDSREDYERLVAISCYPLRQTGRISGAVLLVEDLSDRAELERTARERALLLEAMTKVSRVISSALRLEDVVSLMLDQVDRVVPFDSALIWLQDGHTFRLTAVRGLDDAHTLQPGATLSVDDSPLYLELSTTRRPVLVTDTHSDDRFANDGPPPNRTWLGVPLLSKEESIGALVLQAREPDTYTSTHIEVAMTFANQAAVVLDNARLFEESWEHALELNERAQRLTRLNQVSVELAGSQDVAHILNVGVSEMARATNTALAELLIFDEDTQQGQVAARYSRDDDTPNAPLNRTIPLGESPLVAQIQATHQPVFVADVASDERIPLLRPHLQRNAVVAAHFVPLVSGGQVFGVAALYHRTADTPLTTTELEMAQTVANQAAIAYQNTERRRQLENRLFELRTIYETSTAITSTIDNIALFELISKRVAEALRTDNLYLALYNTDTEDLNFPVAVERGEPRLTLRNALTGLARRVIIRRSPVQFGGARTDDMLRDLGLDPDEVLATAYLGVPLNAGDQAIGVLAVYDLAGERQFSEADLRILSTIASQTTIALENARHFGEAQRRLKESSTLRQVSSTISSSLKLDDIVERVVDELARAFGYPYVSLNMLTSGNQMRMSAQVGYPPPRVNTEAFEPGELTRQALETRRPVFVYPDTTVDDIQVADPSVTSLIIAPLVRGEDVLGTLNVESTDERPLIANDLELVNAFAQQVAIAVENARLYTQTTETAQALEERVRERTTELALERDQVATLLKITTELSASLDLEAVLDRALEIVKDAIDASDGAMFLHDIMSGNLVYRAGLRDSRPAGNTQAVPSLQRGEGLIGWVIDKREAAIVGDLQQDERWLQRPHSTVYNSAIAVPLRASDDLLGAIVFYSDRHFAFNDSHLDLVTAAASQVTAAVNNAELFRLIREQAERLGSMLRIHQLEVSKSRAILESVADGVLVADEDGVAIVFNRAAELVLGLNRDEVLGHHTSEFLGLYGSAGQSWLNAINRWRESPFEQGNSEVLTERLTVDNRIVSIHLTAVFNGDEYIGSVSLFRDITREVEVDRLKTEFVATVSHELRTPMTSIKGFTDLLLMGVTGPLEEGQRGIITKIKSNADRLTMLVEDLLDISRIESGKIALKPAAIDLRDIVQNVAAHLEGRIHNHNKDISMTVRLPDDIPLVVADRNRFTQIITNITDNAFNYTPEGGSITLEVLAHDHHLQVNVIDTGIGLTPEARKRIFERFYRGEDPLVISSAGTGLGLNIVQRLVEMHGGQIWADSEGVGKGSTFSVTIPIPSPETLLKYTTPEESNA